MPLQNPQRRNNEVTRRNGNRKFLPSAPIKMLFFSLVMAMQTILSGWRSFAEKPFTD
jgi:hypothetical protein